MAGIYNRMTSWKQTIALFEEAIEGPVLRERLCNCLEMLNTSHSNQIIVEPTDPVDPVGPIIEEP